MNGLLLERKVLRTKIAEERVDGVVLVVSGSVDVAEVEDKVVVVVIIKVVVEDVVKGAVVVVVNDVVD